MPTNTNAYNSRVTDEALEKRFRDTFRAQGGSELVDDLYAQGVIVPVVDFTQAATGDVLATNLQTAWDSTTGLTRVTSSGTTTLVSNAGFWQFSINADLNFQSGTNIEVSVQIFDGSTATAIWAFAENLASPAEVFTLASGNEVVFLRSGDSLRLSTSAGVDASIWYRQIATVSGDLVNPSGFTSS